MFIIYNSARLYIESQCKFTRSSCADIPTALTEDHASTNLALSIVEKAKIFFAFSKYTVR